MAAKFLTNSLSFFLDKTVTISFKYSSYIIMNLMIPMNLWQLTFLKEYLKNYLPNDAINAANTQIKTLFYHDL